MESNTNTLSTDDMLGALGDVTRRRILVALLEASPLPVGPAGPGDTSASERHHVHLPKLATLNLITWDRTHNHVTTGPTFPEIRPLLVVLDTHCDALPPGFL